jgi:hypothetical protein
MDLNESSCARRARNRHVEIIGAHFEAQSPKDSSTTFNCSEATIYCEQVVCDPPDPTYNQHEL